MRLTRRDAIFAVGASGLGTATASLIADGLLESDGTERVPAENTDTIELSQHSVETLRALAVVLYPSEVEVSQGFVKGYAANHPTPWQLEIQSATEALDSAAKDWTGSPFKTLTESHRNALLRERGIDRVQADSTGTTTQRIRYYLVDGLLFALYSTPKGSSLVGIDNPQGYPGGYASISKPATTR